MVFSHDKLAIRIWFCFSDFDKLNIDPCIPKEWDKFKVHRVWRGAEYDINVVNPNKVNKGVKEIKLNGEIVDFIPDYGLLLPSFHMAFHVFLHRT